MPLWQKCCAALPATTRARGLPHDRLPISPDHIVAAQALLDLEFTPAQRQQMRNVLNDRLAQFASIRAADLDNSIPLSLNFNVNAADPAPATVPRSFRMSAQQSVSRPAALEDAAFYTVTQLAELVRSRQVTSLELTEMYLRRLKRHDPVLQCVAAYTEEIAHAQAKRADSEIALGLYCGPLHGIPRVILAEAAAAAFDTITRDGSVSSMKRQGNSAWPNIFRAARFIPAVEYINANRVRTQLMRDMARVMADIDVFISPSFGGSTLGMTNLTGHPTVVLPNGFTDKGTPTSITFVGGLFKEAETLAVAKAYQDATDWHLQHPNPDDR